MNQRPNIEELADRLSTLLPPGLNALKDELRDNIRAVLQQNLDQLDLVGREQFEATKQMLVNSRVKLEKLEARVAELEQQLQDS